MFDFGNIPRPGGELEASKILKPYWDVITDYLVLFLAVLSIACGGMQLTSGTFECLAVADCPGISRPNMNSSWFSHIEHRNACENFYSTQKNDDIPRTVVVTDLDKSIYYAKFVNSECSKTAVPDFLSYFAFVLFLQAFVLIAFDYLWPKFTGTGSVIESFVSLVKECYELPYPNSVLVHALSNFPRHADDQLPDGRSNETVNIVPHYDSENDELLINNTIEAIKSLSDKVNAFRETLELKRCKIWQLYLFQAIFQLGFSAGTFVLVNIYIKKDLMDTMECRLTQHIPVDHDYFICSHNLAPTFVLAWKSLYCPIWVITIVVFFRKIIWIVWREKGFQYVFHKQTLPSLKAKTLPVDQDLGFLLHLLEFYDKSYVVKFAYFLPQKTKEHQLNVEELQYSL